MSRVRIYELAKEAGLKSKELADKLIALGYPITSHSSTVDDDMAADIRRKVLSSAATEYAEMRIEVKKTSQQQTSMKSKVVRRRSKAEKEEIARQAEQEEIARQAGEEELARQAEQEAAARKAQEAARRAVAEEKAGVAEETPEIMAKSEQREMGAGEEGASSGEEVIGVSPAVEQSAQAEENVVKTEAAGEQPVDEKESAVTREGEPEARDVLMEKSQKIKSKAKERKKKKDEPKQRPKGLAKIVGMVEIPTPQKEEKPKPVRRGAKIKTSMPATGGGAVAGPDEYTDADGSGKNKRKGKRVVALGTEDAESRGKKGIKAKKSRRKIDFTKGDEGEFFRHRKGGRKKDRRLKHAQIAETKAIKKRIKVFETISVGDLAKRMGIKASEVIAKLMGLGVLATVNQSLDIDTASLVAADFGYEVEQGMTEELEVIQLQESEKGGEKLPRYPVVTVMGHVDHGKTSILDAIRKTDVAAGEAGGITQHIGAYHVQSPAGDLVFLDTPGHAAFTEMRSRGAQVTDIVVLVVAADDGVMDQTKEAIAHSKAAGVPIVVAVNKVDKANADPDRVKRELSDFGLMPEDWGGDTIYCHTSAKFNKGIDELLESIQLQAEILELRADPSRKARGAVIEAQLHKGRGPVATVLVQEGTLRAGDYFVAGIYSGKVRTLINDRGELVETAGPSMPVEIQGLSGVPSAGDEFIVVTDEKMAKNVSISRQLKARESELAAASKVSLDNLFEKMAEQEVKELRVVLRADVQGTLEAFTQAAEKLSTNEIRVRVLHEGTGSITENDIHLAAASEAIIIGFNVRPTVKVKELAEREQVDIRSYDVIYHALEDIEKAMVGMLEPTFEERVIGTAEVRQTFHVPKVGTIAGCMVIDGKMERNAKVRVMREGVVIYTGNLSSLKRFKDDAKEVASGFECGIGVENFNDIKVGDNLEAFLMDEVEASL